MCIRDSDMTSLFHIALAGRGVVVTSARERLASYLAVENTYLSTFQVLGGFGLLLGAGVGSAALAVAPHVLTGEGAVPWARLAGLLCLVLAVGLAAGGMAVR